MRRALLLLMAGCTGVMQVPTVEPKAPVRIDGALADVGAAATEELWLTTTHGVERAKAGVLSGVEVSFNGMVKPDLAVAFDSDKALLIAGANAFSVDLSAATAGWEITDLPPVNS